MDQYRLAPDPRPLLLSVEVKPRDAANVTITVLVAGETRAMANAGDKGGKEYLADVSIPAGQEAYVQISGVGAAGDTARYDMIWSVETPMPREEASGEGEEGQEIWDEDGD